MTKQPAKSDNVDDEPEDGVFAIPEGMVIPEEFRGVRKYPPPNMKHLAKKVEGNGAEKYTRDWTGNDTSARNQNGVVYFDESPLRLRLSWKRSKKDRAKVVGVFDLHLRTLLREKYVRIEKGVKMASAYASTTTLMA